MSIFDCDGVLTDGKITYDNNSIEIKNFSAHDGMGFALLHKSGLISAVVTGRSSQALTQRCKDLSIKYVYQGIQKKLDKVQKLIDKLSLNWNQVVYMGDDWNDIPVMNKSAFSVCPSDSTPEIKALTDLTTQSRAGDGAVRECIDFILYKKGLYEQVVQKYLQEICN